jgi:hypothetical protein
VPGTKITDHQVSKYKAERKRATQEIAAAKTGISVRSARRIEQATGLPSQRGERAWRTRSDPLAGVWEEEVVPLLESEPGIRKRVEEVFGWGKTVGPLRKARFVGLEKVKAQTLFTFAAYNLTRMATIFGWRLSTA